MKQLYKRVNHLTGAFVRDDNGAMAIEYALIASATGLALAANLPLIQTELSATYAKILGYLKTMGL